MPGSTQIVRLADVAAVLADPSRATMCLALLDGRAWTVGELARAAEVAASTATEHVHKLTEAGFVATLRQGRHRYVRIEDERVAELIERLAEHADHYPPRGLRASLRAGRLALARTCYDHLAGRLGVALRGGMIEAGLVDVHRGLNLTAEGAEVLDELGIEPARSGRRPLLKECLDWTERREHLSGSLPSALLHRAIDAGWLRLAGDRAIVINDSARHPLARLGVDIDVVRAAA
ncbi:MAG TPA: metalloregulator ArsR/SmtB family transcription factor [Pseudonocardiaceae bacterium]|jgi:DNA-binding transcriptional ArsR family regulator|nr:metalloregulator ArsR/SmtB family transcription factor [Pseudonocardiaceae bacterium]